MISGFAIAADPSWCSLKRLRGFGIQGLLVGGVGSARLGDPEVRGSEILEAEDRVPGWELQILTALM